MVELLQLAVWVGAHVNATSANNGEEQGGVENLRMTREEKVSQRLA